LKSNGYGQMVSVGRFTKEILDSFSIANTTSIKTAWVEICANPLALGRAKYFNEVYLHYGNVLKECIVKIYEGESLILLDTLKSGTKYDCIPLKFPTTPGKIRMVFTSAISPDFYGISLEGGLGVQVDNVAMRGSSGDWVGKNSSFLLSKIYAQQNVGLIIMQFGGNQVPYFKDSMSVVRYGNLFKSQLYRLKKLRPDVAILVLGPSDMSKFSQGTYQTYPFLEQCIAQMKKVALETGAVYWDLYAAMGGENSMPEWVKQGLAGKDYIHFSPRGSAIASQLFTDSFFTAYEKWKGTK
jgi:lysophospholipase L1-like esterase